MRIKLTISYDGTAYCGWQKQTNGVSVQGTIEQAILSLTGEKVKITGSGRTDAGVHAMGQVAHFDINSQSIPPKSFARALNTVLPKDIRILDSVEVDKSFHACDNAKRKTYCYKMYKGRTELPLKERYAVKIFDNVDVTKMQKASRIFLGEHDFRCFNASGGGAKTTVRTIYDISVKQENEDVTFTVTGNGFLYNMVRIMVGAVLRVGESKATEQDLIDMLNSGKRDFSYKTLPAKGLCLVSVVYEE